MIAIASRLRDRRFELGVFFTLWISYAWFWQARDWNSASRLMLTCAIVDRGTLWIDGLHTQTHDLAFADSHYYTEKFPGFSLSAVPVYALAKTLLRSPDHPLNVPGFAYWPTDYWVALGVSGLATAFAGALLVALCRRLGCSPGMSALLGLGYGLATPAYPYATLCYGHQLVASLGLAAFALLWKDRPGSARMFWGGVCASFVSVVELQSAPISAILGLYAIGLWIAGRTHFSGACGFALGALGPALILASYNFFAFGSPWDLGYFHLANEFVRVHTKDNPLGFVGPDWTIAGRLLWGEYRGLLFYAPLLALAAPGWIALTIRGHREVAAVSSAICAGVFLVNLSYPEWTGGWATGPRMLVPLLPFGVLAVAGIAGIDPNAGGRVRAIAARLTRTAIVILIVWGWALMTLFQGVGARIPQSIPAPLTEGVWPLWRGDPTPPWVTGERFVRMPIWQMMAELPESQRWLGLGPLVFGQALALWGQGRRRSRPLSSSSSSSLSPPPP